MELIELFLASILSNNIALIFILGMCSLIAVSTSIKNSVNMGVAVIFVVTITAIINWPIYELLKATGTEQLALLVFIIVIAAFVQFLEMFLAKYFPKIYESFGIFLPLITVNCIVLSVSLFFQQRNYDFLQTTVFAFGSSVGWTFAMILLAGVRQKMYRVSNLPKGLRGRAIAFLILGILALAFIGFTGIGRVSF
ncbi:Rnf-Nqr domain containing protein [Acholeplasma laidlawii]|uniref:Na+-transporting NADH:ubiquinone oxidoreductase subunit E n=2 Tax=Acholeplasma laidlawii TaxID=2148 RepID=A9NGU9_ACHLI|nr:Rnf-Nqr domain containing protein [Acholeplasma laidlawii]ABX81579.1 Na+-transporting NADH:ubiquinone oxidoreductase subunit E [Acholeplasma laidlawii PG-8A]OED59302.1 NADH:ubiquinone reductase (Na(+)-transporting) subunit E [Acholeplasma laidlawii]RED20662.1 Na+-transporting NADH:ubiquinone oxidoreductase subunit E [Acholeplasma laidlawii]